MAKKKECGHKAFEGPLDWKMILVFILLSPLIVICLFFLILIMVWVSFLVLVEIIFNGKRKVKD